MERIAFQVSVRSTERLDRFLADQLSLSRTHAARLVAGGNVTVNDEKARASRTLKFGDAVVVEYNEKTVAPPRFLKANPLPLDVVYEDDAFLILNKPAGLVVHPAPGHWEDTLLNALVARGTSLPDGSGDGGGRPGIVHRLDKDTSGLMVLAKTDDAHRILARQISQRRVKRVYAALIWGHVEKPIEINEPLARHPNDRKRMAVLATGRDALTYVEPVARFDVCDLVLVRLGTGRTHQIRVHLAYVGHPVVGDPVYGGGGYKRMTGSQRTRSRALEAATPRQALHATKLAFLHPETQKPVEFVADWPSDLKEALVYAGNDQSLLDRADLLGYFGFSG